MLGKNVACHAPKNEPGDGQKQPDKSGCLELTGSRTSAHEHSQAMHSLKYIEEYIEEEQRKRRQAQASRQNLQINGPTNVNTVREAIEELDEHCLPESEDVSQQYGSSEQLLGGQTSRRG